MMIVGHSSFNNTRGVLRSSCLLFALLMSSSNFKLVALLMSSSNFRLVTNRFFSTPRKNKLPLLPSFIASSLYILKIPCPDKQYGLKGGCD